MDRHLILESFSQLRKDLEHLLNEDLSFSIIFDQSILWFQGRQAVRAVWLTNWQVWPWVTVTSSQTSRNTREHSVCRGGGELDTSLTSTRQTSQTRTRCLTNKQTKTRTHHWQTVAARQTLAWAGWDVLDSMRLQCWSLSWLRRLLMRGNVLLMW